MTPSDRSPAVSTFPDSDDVLDVFLLSRYVAGDIDIAGRARVERWLAADPARAGIVEALQQEWLGARAPEAQQAWQRFQTRRLWRHGERRNPRLGAGSIGKSSVVRSPIARLHTKFHGFQRTRMFTGVAVVGLLSAVGVIVARQVASSHNVIASHTYRTVSGQQATLTLRDGSQVILAPASQLTVTRDFNRDSRAVSLEGEAFFTVEPLARAPFVVTTGPVSAQVMGTRFGVRRYAADRSTYVAVVTGKVIARGYGAALTLAASELGVLADSSVRVRRDRSLDPFTTWTRGTIVFDNEPLPTVLARLGRWYGYEFRLADSSLASARVSAVFRTGAPGEAMNVLREMLEVSMVVDGQVVTLVARGKKLPALERRERQSVVSIRTEVGK